MYYGVQVSRGAKSGEIGLAQATALLASKGLLREWRVQQTSGVTGDPAARRVHVLCLSRDDVRMAFSSCLSFKDQIRRLRPLPRKTGRANPLPLPSSAAAEHAQEVPSLPLP